jgi:hypothetical protein
MKHIQTFESFLNESIDQSDYKKIVDAVDAHKKDIKAALYKATAHMYWRIEVLPIYDNKIGGYNLHAFATTVAGLDNTIDDVNIKRAIDSVRKLPFVSKAKRSNMYNKNMITAIAIGLKIQ